MKVIRSREFNKQIKRVRDKKTKARILAQIKKIIKDPEKGRYLSHEDGVKKIYIPPFRLLYALKNETLYLLDFDHRDKVYKKRRK